MDSELRTPVDLSSFSSRTDAGTFVCLEGIDGAGKTTAVGRCVDELRRRGLPAAALDKHQTGFGSAYVQRHMGELRRLIWGHPADDPYLELGDMHWVH